jgi:hypothetical protein
MHFSSLVLHPDEWMQLETQPLKLKVAWAWDATRAVPRRASRRYLARTIVAVVVVVVAKKGEVFVGVRDIEMGGGSGIELFVLGPVL